MGGASSQGTEIPPKGHAHVEVRAPNVQAGQVVAGAVHLYLMSRVNAQTINLIFSGLESVRWYEPPPPTLILNKKRGNRFQQRRRERERRKKRRQAGWKENKQVIMSQKFPIFILANGFMDPGQYTFPFNIQLPQNLAGSFHYRRGKTAADINYSLESDVSPEVASSEVELNIFQTLNDPIYSLADKTGTDLKAMCCLSKGRVEMQTSLERNVYTIGEQANIDVQIDNQNSQCEVRAATGTLYRSITLRIPSKQHVESDIVSSARGDKVIPAGTALSSDTTIRVALPIQGGSEEERLPTVKGNIVECRYYVKMVAIMGGSSTQPQVERFVQIFPPQVHVIMPPSVPPNWNPQVMQPINLAYNAAYQYQMPEEESDSDDEGS